MPHKPKKYKILLCSQYIHLYIDNVSVHLYQDMYRPSVRTYLFIQLRLICKKISCVTLTRYFISIFLSESESNSTLPVLPAYFISVTMETTLNAACLNMFLSFSSRLINEQSTTSKISANLIPSPGFQQRTR